MSNWSYVAIAYIVVWGALAFYALILARRVYQARQFARSLRAASESHRPVVEQETAVCDAPPAP